MDFPSCTICGSGRRQPLYVRKGWLALGCERCGVLKSFPRQPEEQVREYYTSSEGWERGKLWPDGETLEEYLLRRREPYFEEVEALLPRLTPPSAGGGRAPRVLDFGCGVGITLDVFAELGWQTAGIEPAPRSAEIAAQRHTLVDSIPPEPSYDLVVAAHVFEHVPNPLEIVRSLFRATLPGGQIYVGVPNLDRLPEHGLFRHLLNRQHLYAYSSVAMRSVLEAGGYRDVETLAGPEWTSATTSAASARWPFDPPGAESSSVAVADPSARLTPRSQHSRRFKARRWARRT